MYEIEYLLSHVSEEVLLEQLAEEAAELAHAALKLKRALYGGNPTPITKTMAMEALVEELADMGLCRSLVIEALQIDRGAISDKRREKLHRWARRLVHETDT